MKMRSFSLHRGIWMMLGLLTTVSMSVMAKDAGAEKKPSLRVVLEMADGSRLVGTPAEKSLRLNTEYMKMELPLVKIRQCEIRHQEERALLTLHNGDKLTGTLEMHQFRLTSALGKLAPDFAKIDRMTFTSSKDGTLPADDGPSAYTPGKAWVPQVQGGKMPPGVSFGSPQWTTAAPDSVEGQLRSQGKHWVRSTGEIAVGAYVLDILEGRLGQPQGRGAIGKVISTDYNGQPVAIVDFGRDYSVGILLSELSLVTVVPESRKAEAEKKAALRVVLDMADSSRLVGTPAEKSLRVNTEYMKGEIALAKIRQCDVRHQEERVVLTLQNGDKLTGILEMDKFRVVTSLGKLAPEFAQIDRLTFSTSQPHGFSPTAAIKMPPQPLNIDFGVWKPNPSPQTGPAAAGREGDFWNAVAVPWNNAHIEGGLKSATGDPSPVQVEMNNLGGGWTSGGGMGVKSPMLDTFNYPVNNRGGNSQVILHQVPPGKYDLYLYGHKPEPLYYGDYTLTVGGHSYGRKTTFHEDDSGQNTEWVEGSQYVKFAGVKVAPGDKVEILIRPGGETTVGRTIREYPDGLLDRNGPSPGLKLDEETAPAFKGAGPQHPESDSTVTWSGRHYSGPLKMGTAPGGLRHTLADAMICGLQLIPVK